MGPLTKPRARRTEENVPSGSRAEELPVAERPCCHGWGSHLVVGALFCVLAVVSTWPLATAGRLPGGNNDLFQNAWNLWHWHDSLAVEGRSPYSTDRLFGGSETSLAFHTHSEANALLSLPLTALGGPAAALSILTLLGFALAGYGGWVLARELGADGSSALLAGIVLALFPQHFEQSLEHLNLASYGAMPLFLAGIVRGTRHGSTSGWLLAAVGCALNALFAWHNALMILPGAIGLFAFEFVQTRASRGRVLRGALLAGAATLLVVLPCAWPKLREILAGASYFQKPPVDRGVDLAFFIIPSLQHPLWGPVMTPLYEAHRNYRAVGFTAYLGLGVLSMATIPWLVRRKPAHGQRLPGRSTALFWLGFAAVYLLLSLGSELRVLGNRTGVPLPFAWLETLPLASTLRVANRFIVPAMLALAVLAALGLQRLRAGSRRPVAWLLGAALLVLLDFQWVPYPLRPAPNPPWITATSTLPDGTLLNIPGGYRARAAEDMWLQTLHGRPIVGGYVSCTPPNASALLERHPYLRSIHEAERSPTYREHTDLEGLASLLDDTSLDIEVVVIHLDRSRERILEKRREHEGTYAARYHNPEKGLRRAKIEAARAAMERLWGPPVWADDATRVYRRTGE